VTGPLWKIKPPLDIPPAGIRLGPGHQQTDGLWLGTLAELSGGKVPRIWLSTAKEQVVAIVGKRGSGKSFTLGVLAEGLALASSAAHVANRTRPRAALLFDPLDVYWTTRYSIGPSANPEAARHFELAEGSKLTGLRFNVEAWLPGTTAARPSDPAWFRPLQLPVPLLGLDEWEILLDVNTIMDPMGQALADALNLVRSTGYHRRGQAVPPESAFDLERLIDAAGSDELGVAYQDQTRRAIRQRLASLQNTGLFSPTGTPIASLLAADQLTVILLGRLPQSYRSAVVAVLTRMLLEDRASVAFAEKRLELDPSLTVTERQALQQIVRSGAPRTVVALDEAQTFLAPGVGGPAKEVFIRLVKEGRNIGLSAILATQQPSALDQRVLSQVETFITHQLVTEPDIRAVRDNLKSSVPDGIEFGPQHFDDIAGLLRRLSPGQCLISAADMNSNVRRSLVVAIRPRATVHGGIEL
jgi:DNA helicase HerA-like ATPase